MLCAFLFSTPKLLNSVREIATFNASLGNLNKQNMAQTMFGNWRNVEISLQTCLKIVFKQNSQSAEYCLADAVLETFNSVN